MKTLDEAFEAAIRFAYKTSVRFLKTGAII